LVVIARYATVCDFFALAQNLAATHIAPAFQASSPKTSQPGWFIQPGFFLVRLRRRKIRVGAAPNRLPVIGNARPAS
jgi:hypothetical protein